MVEHYGFWVILGHVYGLLAEFHSIDSVLDDTIACLYNYKALLVFGNFGFMYKKSHQSIVTTEKV